MDHERNSPEEEQTSSKLPLILGAAAVALLAGLLFVFLFDLDADTTGGDLDVELPETNIDVDAPEVEIPDVDVEVPDVDIDPGSVDVEGELDVDPAEE